MADWKRLTHAMILADGRLTPAAADAIRTEMGADGTVNREEVEFLVGIRRAVRVPPEFDRYVLDLVLRAVLHDGRISPPEAAWLKRLIFSDGHASAAELHLLKQLKESAVVTCPEFDELVHDHQSI